MKLLYMVAARKSNPLIRVDKIKLIESVKSGSKKKHDIAKEFKILNSILSTILENKNKIIQFFNKLLV